MSILKYLIISFIMFQLSGAYIYAEESSPKVDLCKTHQLKNTECFICNSSLRVKGRLWCKEHDRYEDRCWKCHADLEDKSRMFCKEHSLYEDECYFCHPDSEKAVLLKNKSLGDKAGEATCKKHQLNKKSCFICDSSLRTKGRLWCKEHDRYEDRCWKCHSDLEDKQRPYCKEHHLYEDECIFCNPKINMNEASIKSPNPILICNEHNVPEHECGICHPQLANDLKVGESMKIRFATKDSTRKAGIKTSLAQESSSVSQIEVYSKVNYDKNNYAQISPFTSGIVKNVLVNVGADVKQGDVIAEMHSMDIAKAKSTYLASINDCELKKKHHTREKKLFSDKVTSIREIQEAEASYIKSELLMTSLKQQLFNYGFSDSEINQIIESQDSSSRFEIKAPFDGRILDRKVVVGEYKDMGDMLFTLANISKMWLELTIPEDLVHLVEKGQTVTTMFNHDPSRSEGILIWIDTSVNENDRMVKARAVISNANGKLKEGMFGKANIVMSAPKNALRIPNDAVHQLDNQDYVFVKVEDDLFDLRRIDIGGKNGEYVDIIDGIHSDERIVVAGKFTMVSEYLKSRLGAGCVDD